MNNSLLKKLLVDLPIFHHLDDDEYRILAFIGKRFEYISGDELYAPFDASQDAILMTAGRALVRSEDLANSDIVARRGALINELSLFSEKQYAHSVQALEPISVVHFFRDDFMHLMQEYPEIGHKVQRNLAGRLAKFAQEVHV